MFLDELSRRAVVSVAFAIDGHDREVPPDVPAPRPVTEAAIRTPMDRALWARFAEAAGSHDTGARPASAAPR